MIAYTPDHTYWRFKLISLFLLAIENASVSGTFLPAMQISTCKQLMYATYTGTQYRGIFQQNWRYKICRRQWASCLVLTSLTYFILSFFSSKCLCFALCSTTHHQNIRRLHNLHKNSRLIFSIIIIIRVKFFDYDWYDASSMDDM